MLRPCALTCPTSAGSICASRRLWVIAERMARALEGLAGRAGFEGVGKTGDAGQDLRAARLGMLPTFENEGRRAFAIDHAVATGVERARDLFRRTRRRGECSR